MDRLLDTRRVGLGLLIAIFIFAAVILWLGGPTILPNGGLTTASASDFYNDSQAEAQAELQQIEVYFNEKFLVGDYELDNSWSENSWVRNPFLTPEEIDFFNGPGMGASENGDLTESGVDAMALSMILISDEKKVAVLNNGKLLSVGDKIGNELVARIDVEGVVLAGNNETRRIDLPQSEIQLQTTLEQ